MNRFHSQIFNVLGDIFFFWGLIFRQHFHNHFLPTGTRVCLHHNFALENIQVWRSLRWLKNVIQSSPPYLLLPSSWEPPSSLYRELLLVSTRPSPWSILGLLIAPKSNKNSFTGSKHVIILCTNRQIMITYRQGPYQNHFVIKFFWFNFGSQGFDLFLDFFCFFPCNKKLP